MAENKKVVGMWRHNHAEQGAEENAANAVGSNAPVETDLDTSLILEERATEESACTESANQSVDNSLSSETDSSQDWLGETYADDAAPATTISYKLTVAALLIATVGWLGFAGYALATELRTGKGLLAFAQQIAILCAPLALLAALAIWVQRTSLSETQRYAKLISELRTETAQLETRLSGATSYIRSSQDQLLDAANKAVNHSLEAANTLTSAAHSVADAGGQIEKTTTDIAEHTAVAKRNMETVLAGLPKVDVVAQRMAENVRQAGLIAHKHGSNLEAKIAAIGEASNTSSKLLTDLATEVEAKLAHIIERSRDTGLSFERDLGQKIATVQASLATSHTAAASMGSLLDAHDSKAQAITQTLEKGASKASTALTKLDTESSEILARLSTALVTLEQRSQAADSAMQAGRESAAAFHGTADDVLTALDAVLREIDESMPAAFARLDGKAADSRALLASIEPGLGRAEASVETILGRMRESEALMTEQSRVFEGIATSGHSAIEDQRAQLAALEDGIERVRNQSDAVTQSVGPQMVEALVRVRETAAQAADKAREAISGVIPETSDKLALAVADAMENAIRGRVEEQMAAISEAAQRAVSAAHKASERLMRQMITIADTSANIEKRVEEAHSHAEAAMQDNLARTLSLLTDALNSTAIDVTSLLSSEISDTAWEAYLRGDKGVFTRRAVKLLANSEAKEILRRYESDDGFRAHVNRYIHDFEAMLKSILNLREGQSISVTLLSSDIGKLYVALAQAIDRLRA